ncbi:MAG: MGDG synthase family glycosyltransferase [Massilia sp.]
MTLSKAPRLVLLSVSAGAGHVRAAAALDAQAREAGFEAVHIDIMQRVPAWFRWVYADLYAILVNRAPFLWRCLYAAMNHPAGTGLLHRARRAIERRVSRVWLRELASLAPDAIVCTHFLPAEVLGQSKNQRSKAAAGQSGPPAVFACPVYVHVTDFDLHAMWIQPGVASYFVACDEVGFQLRRAGVDAARIEVSGIALTPGFRPMARQDGVLRAHGFDPARMTVLLMGGGGGFGQLERLVPSLLNGADGFQLLVLAGRNAGTLAALQSMAVRWPGRLAAVGFTDQVAQLMASVDLVISKPGGLTSSECLAIGVAMIANAPIPGQEERNADHLLEQGVALKAIDHSTLVYRLRHLLDDADRRQAMALRARSLGRPDAARDIIHAITLKLKATS